MSTALIEQVATQWLADYTTSFLNDGEATEQFSRNNAAGAPG